MKRKKKLQSGPLIYSALKIALPVPQNLSQTFSDNRKSDALEVKNNYEQKDSLLNNQLRSEEKLVIPEILQAVKASYDGKNDFIYKVKLPLLIAQPRMEICLEENIHFNEPVETITHLDWSISSYSCQLLLPGNQFIARGELHANLQYVSENLERKVFCQTFSIPWEKSMEVTFLNPPLKPSETSSKEFSYRTSESTKHCITQREQTIHKNENPLIDLMEVKVISLDDLENNCFHIQVVAELDFYIFQQHLLDVAAIITIK